MSEASKARERRFETVYQMAMNVLCDLTEPHVLLVAEECPDDIGPSETIEWIHGRLLELIVVAELPEVGR